jgi:hypothetical protein
MDLAVLLDERAIYRQLCALAEAMDKKDWKMLDDILLEDATGNFGDGHQLKGRADFVGMFSRFLGSCGPTQHLLGNVLIDVDGDRARSSCYIRDMHQGLDGLSHLHLSTPGEYHDEWKRTEEGWRLAHRTKLTKMFIGDVATLGLESQDAS